MYFNKKDEDGVLIYQVENEKGELEEVEGECKCEVKYANNCTKYLELAFLMCGFVVEIATVVYMLYSLFHEAEESHPSHDL